MIENTFLILWSKTDVQMCSSQVDKGKLNLIEECVKLFCNEYSKICYHSGLDKKERAYQLISQQIPEGKVLQRNNWFVKCSLTIQTSSLKMSDRWNVRMFGSLQISFWNTNSRNTSYKNTSFWNTSFWNTSVVVVVVVVVVCGTGTGSNWSMLVLGQKKAVLVSTWWYWVSMGRHWSVLGGTGSI